MRQALAFGLSLGSGLLMTWAGLHYDRVLLYLGLLVIVAVIVLWLWTWSTEAQRAPVPGLLGHQDAPAGLDDKAKALLALRRARDNAVVAIAQGNDRTRARAYNEVEAAMLSTKKQFGIGPLQITSKTHSSVPYKLVLEAYVAFIDQIHPLLCEGHIEEARAKKFNYSYGD